MGQSIITTWNGKGNYASYHLLEEERMTTASNKKFPVITVCNKYTRVSGHTPGLMIELIA